MFQTYAVVLGEKPVHSEAGLSVVAYEALLRKLKSRKFKRKGTFIGIEGYMGSGKTTLAKRLSNDLRVRLISLDDFVVIRNGNRAH